MEIVGARVKRNKKKRYCVIGKLGTPRRVGRMMSDNVMGGCFTSKKEADERARSMKDGTWRPKGSNKRGKRR